MLLAETAGQILLTHYRTSLDVDYKNNDAYDPVTVADREVDDFLRQEILKLFPEDLVLSEENDDVPADYSKRIWMIDPLDGTKEFLNHTDGFAINIGLWSGDKIVFGLVFAPVSGRLFFAEMNSGAWERLANDSFKKLHVTSVADIRDARLLTRTASKDYRPLDVIVESIPAKEKIADSRIKICRIAAGEAEAHVNTNFRGSKWDTLAPQLILEEAGGVVTDIDGRTLNYRQPDLRWERSFVCANNKEMLSQILDVLKNKV